MSDELPADATIYVASTDRTAAHTDPSCRHLQHVDATAYERRAFPDLPVCRHCEREVPCDHGDPWQRVKAIEDADPEDLGLDPLVE